MADTLMEEIQKRILDLENEKKKVEDVISWRQNESPKLSKEMDAMKAELHDLRAQLAELKKPAAPVPAGGDNTTGDAYHGFFS